MVREVVSCPDLESVAVPPRDVLSVEDVLSVGNVLVQGTFPRDVPCLCPSSNMFKAP